MLCDLMVKFRRFRFNQLTFVQFAPTGFFNRHERSHRIRLRRGR